MVYQVSTRFLDHGLSFWKKLCFHLNNHGLLLEKSKNLTTYTVLMFLLSENLKKLSKCNNFKA
jgi:hypothetical protein